MFHLCLLLCASVAAGAENSCDAAAGMFDETALLQQRVISFESQAAEKKLAATEERLNATRVAIVTDPFAEVPPETILHATRYGVTFIRSGSLSLKYRMRQQPQSSFVEHALRLAGPTAVHLGVEEAQKALTTVECKGGERDRTCAFRNLYFNEDEGGFYVFTLKGQEHPDFNSVMLLHKWTSKGQIKRLDFSSLDGFRQFLEAHKPKQHTGLSLVYDSIWHFNIAHAIWDGLYPAFVALRYWGRHNEMFRSVIGIDLKCNQLGTEDGKCMSEGVFRRFGGDEFMPYGKLQGSGWHVFTDAIAGSGRKGQRSLNRNYTLPGGRDLDAARLFRDRIYTTHGLKPPVPRSTSNEQQRSLRGIVVHNKRFNQDEVELLKAMALDPSPVQLNYTDYASGALAGNFRRQLEMIRDADVHISGPGTAQSYAPFLRDGAIHVNLGDRRSPFNYRHDKHFVSFMEEVWAEGVPYIRALYYDPYMQLPADLESDAVRELVQMAADNIHSGFRLPVQPGDNLSPVAKTFKAYCYASTSDCNDLISLLNGDRSAGFDGVEDEWWCNLNTWAEDIVFESGGWSEQGQIDGNRTVHCSINRGLLRRVRAEYLRW